jgi:hypothetical protein
VIPPKADVSASGPINGMGERDYHGSYVQIAVVSEDGKQQAFRVSFGGADQLRADLVAILRLMAGREAA